ncbi:hypothetical protein HK098_000814 [Nowakowskiella sp. JEL0407]|nr:hypothetical protein HK098_000814 [Nowakowskiella sp. JEL0407]
MFTTILLIALPSLLPRILSFFSRKTVSNNEAHRSPKSSNSKLDSYVSIVLLTFIAFEAFRLFNRPPSILETLQISKSTPYYIVQSRLREYMSATFPNWSESLSIEEKSALPNAQEILNFEELRLRLRTIEYRSQYLNFGHDAFVNCKWCVSDNDFKIYMLPYVLGNYGTAFLGLGLGTLSRKKSFWRLYVVFALSVSILFEIYVYGTDNFELIPNPSVTVSTFTLYYILRRGLFLLLASLVLFIDGPSSWTDAEILEDVIRKHQFMYSRSQGARLARAAALRDGNLRTRFLEFYKKAEAEDAAFHREEEYKELREKALRQFNIDKILADAKYLSEQTIGSAQREGIFSIS